MCLYIILKRTTLILVIIDLNISLVGVWNLRAGERRDECGGECSCGVGLKK